MTGTRKLRNSEGRLQVVDRAQKRLAREGKEAGLDEAQLESLTAQVPAPQTQTLDLLIVTRRRETGVSIPLETTDEVPELIPQNSREDYESACSSTLADIDEVIEFAQHFNLEVDSLNGAAPGDPNFRDICAARRMVRLSGSVENIQNAFSVDLKYHIEDGELQRSHHGEPATSDTLADIIECVFGLETFSSKPLPNHMTALTASREELKKADFNPLHTQEIADFYQFPRSLLGRDECIGILAPFGGFRESDMRSYFNSIPQARGEVIAVGGPNDPDFYNAKTPMSNIEATLDAQVAAAAAPEAKVAVYVPATVSNDNGDFPQRLYEVLSNAIHDDVNRPSVLSISWGGPEHVWKPNEVKEFEELLKDAVHLGVTVCVSTGDSGAGPPVGRGHVATPPEVNYPASSPWTLACGGTSLKGIDLATGHRDEETAWNDMSKMLYIGYSADDDPNLSRNGAGASGGGVSDTHAPPGYQKLAEVPNKPVILWFDGKVMLREPTVGRGIPDVSANADISTGYEIVFEGSSAVGGGTSAAAPLWAGLIARINQGLGRPIGFINPILYHLQLAKKIAVCHPITKGNNGGYEAAGEWDACTGLGTPIGESLLDTLKEYYAATSRSE